MRKMILAVVMMLAASLGAVSVPASAGATEPTYFGAWHCQTNRDISTCVSLDWARQADGTGVRLEGLQVRTERGCGSLEDGGKYNPVKMWAQPENTGQIDYAYDFGEEDCAFYKDLSNAVGESGNALITIEIKQRINFAGDRWLGWTIRLRPGGDSNVVDTWQAST